MMSEVLTAPLIGISRHRLATDGKGVTTLVAFHGCPLRCKYCLNDQCHDTEKIFRVVTPSQLLDELMIDNLYFLATGGGVCFGGGEPLLYSDFIQEFCKIKVPEWKVTLETSLNVPLQQLVRIKPYVTQYIIDIKDVNSDIYHSYTGVNNVIVLDNLQWLLSEGLSEHIVVRVPHIPDYNTEEDVARSKAILTEIGVVHLDEFTYKR